MMFIFYHQSGRLTDIEDKSVGTDEYIVGDLHRAIFYGY